MLYVKFYKYMHILQIREPNRAKYCHVQVQLIYGTSLKLSSGLARLLDESNSNEPLSNRASNSLRNGWFICSPTVSDTLTKPRRIDLIKGKCILLPILFNPEWTNGIWPRNKCAKRRNYPIA